MVHEEKKGLRTRMSFSQIQELVKMPDLIEVQKNSYRYFVDEGLNEVFNDFFPISNDADRSKATTHLEFLGCEIDVNSPKVKSIDTCREQEATYSAPLYANFRLIYPDGSLRETKIFMGDFPVMTPQGTFIINGAERVIVSQLVRSPGAYFDSEIETKNGNVLYSAQVIPNRGSWLEFETDKKNLAVKVNVNRTKNVYISTFIRAYNLCGTDDKNRILEFFGVDPMAAGNREKTRLENTFDAAEKITVKNSKKENKGEGGNYADARITIYKKLKSGEERIDEGEARKYIESLYFDGLRYDLGKVGRYKINKKLCLSERIVGLVCARNVVADRDIIDYTTGEIVISQGEVIVEQGETITADIAHKLETLAVEGVFVYQHSALRNAAVKMDESGLNVDKVMGNRFVEAKYLFDFWNTTINDNVVDFGIEPNDKIHYPTFVALMALAQSDNIISSDISDEAEKKKAVENYVRMIKDSSEYMYANLSATAIEDSYTTGAMTGDDLVRYIAEYKNLLVPRHIIKDDMIASISYILGLPDGIGKTDDIDHLGNRRIRSVGELLQNQMRQGLSRLEKTVRERMQTHGDLSELSVQSLINTRPIIACIREFFGSSQLSQFMDQTNPLAELTHKRRLSALGPGGINRDRATFEVRDVHYSHYGRMCPIETPEGPNIGLINSLSTYAKINKYGFIETPYRIVDAKNKNISMDDSAVKYITADDEDGAIIAQASEPLVDNGKGGMWFKNEHIIARQRDQILSVEANKVSYMDVSPKQLISIATGMIPFLANDDANRALMGSNMQRQAVPLLVPEAPIVATGIEDKAAYDSGVMVIAQESGYVKRVSASEICIADEVSGAEHVYRLAKFRRSNQGTCINQRTLVKKNQKITKGDILADGASTDMGEISLGRNILIGFMTWEGYNYEDAVLISEELVRDDVYTSIHIEKYEIEARDIKQLGAEEITADITNVGADAKANLDSEGIIYVGAEVHAGDILVGKVTPKGETEETPEDRLLRAIFGEKTREVRDTSLRVPHGEDGIVVDVKKFYKGQDNGAELSPGVNQLVRVYIAQKRKISVGDKMAGRHGNKGVISRILPVEDMPFLPDGTPLQIVLNPLGVPSRMNIGQVLELHLGIAAKKKGWHVATPAFDGANEADIERLLCESYKERNFKKLTEQMEISPLLANQILDTTKLTEEHRKAVISEVGKNVEKNFTKIGNIAEDKENAFTVLTEELLLSDDLANNIIANGMTDDNKLSVMEEMYNDCYNIVKRENDSADSKKLIDLVKKYKSKKAADDIARMLIESGDGKTILYDGRSGDPFENRISVGYMYYLKLAHLVDDKIHARSTGPYSLVTQQPLGGKAQFGGQRFGEMEVWALEAYGAAHTLQEILTIKSDDITGRSNAFSAIIHGQNVPEPGIPESFKVLIKELQSLALDVTVLDANDEEIPLDKLVTAPEPVQKSTVPSDKPKAESEESNVVPFVDNSDAGYDDDDDFSNVFGDTDISEDELNQSGYHSTSEEEENELRREENSVDGFLSSFGSFGKDDE